MLNVHTGIISLGQFLYEPNAYFKSLKIRKAVLIYSIYIY